MLAYATIHARHMLGLGCRGEGPIYRLRVWLGLGCRGFWGFLTSRIGLLDIEISPASIQLKRCFIEINHVVVSLSLQKKSSPIRSDSEWDSVVDQHVIDLLQMSS